MTLPGSEEKSQVSNKTPWNENTPRVVSSEDLFRGRQEVIINHQQNLYRLMITKAGKLILNK